MAPYEYLVMKFANQWTTREQILHQELSQKTISTESVAKALHYFQVARTFDGLKNEDNRTLIVKNLLEHSKYLTKNNFHEKVQELAESFKEQFGKTNLSAASKLLWLRKKSPVLIFDKWAKLALESLEQKKIGGYSDYSEVWNRNYYLHQNKIKDAAANFINVRQYSALWDKSTSECQDIVLSDWFLERVFDMYLLSHGKSSKIYNTEITPS